MDQEQPVWQVAKNQPLTVWARARGYLYRALQSLRSHRWWLRTGIVVGFWVMIGLPLYRVNIAHGILHTAFSLLVVFGRAVRFSGPLTLPQVEFEYLSRKGRLYKLLKTMQRRENLTRLEIAEYQKEALCLIVSFVRGHRADPSGTEIFANLLVEDGNDLVVVARNQDHRNPGARYPKDGMLAWGAILSGNSVCMGDIKKCAPSQASTKPYRSIMAIPVMGEDRILGAVSIDSTRPHHFDAEMNDLERYLAPYVCLLGWSIAASGSMIVEQPVATDKGRTQ